MNAVRELVLKPYVTGPEFNLLHRDRKRWIPGISSASPEVAENLKKSSAQYHFRWFENPVDYAGRGAIVPPLSEGAACSDATGPFGREARKMFEILGSVDEFTATI